MVRRIGFLATTLLVAGACSDPTDALQYENRRPFDPPMEIYSRWWSEVEQCSDRSRDLVGIRWFLADAIGLGTGPVVGTVKGQWLSNREITIRTGEQMSFDVVKHEMLHDLLRGDAFHEHEGWGTCDRREGPPGDPLIPTGVYDYALTRTLGLREWRFEGTLTITSATEDQVQGSWDVVSTNDASDGSYAEELTSGHWDYDAYAVGARIVGEPGWQIENRIARVDGEVRCLVARIGLSAVACTLDGPR